MATYSELGAKLKQFRINSLLTQQQVADALSINRTTYTYYETGKTEPSIETLFKLIKIFGITYDDLLPTVSEENLEDIATKANAKEAIYNLSKIEQQCLINMRAMEDDERNEILKKLL